MTDAGGGGPGSPPKPPPRAPAVPPRVPLGAGSPRGSGPAARPPPDAPAMTGPQAGGAQQASVGKITAPAIPKAIAKATGVPPRPGGVPTRALTPASPGFAPKSVVAPAKQAQAAPREFMDTKPASPPALSSSARLPSGGAPE